MSFAVIVLKFSKIEKKFNNCVPFFLHLTSIQNLKILQNPPVTMYSTSLLETALIKAVFRKFSKLINKGSMKKTI